MLPGATAQGRFIKLIEHIPGIDDDLLGVLAELPGEVCHASFLGLDRFAPQGPGDQAQQQDRAGEGGHREADKDTFPPLSR